MDNKSNFSAIPNSMLEKLYQTELTKRELKICLCIARYTYGFNQEYWHTSGKFISKSTGINTADVSRAFKSLSDRKIIITAKSKKFSFAVKLNSPDQWLDDIQNAKKETRKKSSENQSSNHVSIELPGIEGYNDIDVSEFYEIA